MQYSVFIFCYNETFCDRSQNWRSLGLLALGLVCAMGEWGNLAWGHVFRQRRQRPNGAWWDAAYPHQRWTNWAQVSLLLQWLHSDTGQFLAATKQLNEWYFRPSVCYTFLTMFPSSWNFQELLPMTEVTSMQKVKVRGQRSRSQRSTPNLAVSGP